MTDEPTPKLTKREADERVFGLDVAGKLRKGDAVTGFLSLTNRVASPSPTAAQDNLVVAIHPDTPVAENDSRRMALLQFTCSGGTKGTLYLLALRYSSTTEDVLESILNIEVF